VEFLAKWSRNASPRVVVAHTSGHFRRIVSDQRNHFFARKLALSVEKCTLCRLANTRVAKVPL